MTQLCSLCHGHSLDLETVKRESLADPYYGSETYAATWLFGGFYAICVDIGRKTSDSSLISNALLLNMNALVPMIDLEAKKPR